MSRRSPAPVRVLAGLTGALAVLAACGGDTGAAPAGDASAATTTSYVALGDSYTAGPLIPPADPAGGCLRSGSNYPSLVAAARDDLVLTDVSCSGSGTVHLTSPQTIGAVTHPPQLDALDEGTDLVTLSIGGNDDGLIGALLGVCQQLAVADPDGAPCATGDATGPDPVSARLDRLGDSLGAAFAAVRDRAPRARLVVVGYPQVVPTEGGCPELGLAPGDQAWAYRLNRDLARTVQDAARAAELEYVDAWAASAGHDVCATDPWFNGRTTDEGAALAYHPFRAYEAAVAALLLELL